MQYVFSSPRVLLFFSPVLHVSIWYFLITLCQLNRISFLLFSFIEIKHRLDTHILFVDRHKCTQDVSTIIVIIGQFIIIKVPNGKEGKYLH